MVEEDCEVVIEDGSTAKDRSSSTSEMNRSIQKHVSVNMKIQIKKSGIIKYWMTRT